jgi:hypothetical protein
MVVTFIFVLIANFYFSSIVKDGYNELYGDMGKSRKIILLIPPVGTVFFLVICVYFITILLIDKFRDYFS